MTVDASRPDQDVERDADERERNADTRERELDEREVRLESREAAVKADQRGQAHRILAAGDERDERAAAREVVSAERDMAANFEAWLNEADDDVASEARRLAVIDRSHAANDRSSAALDRLQLALEGNPGRSDDAEDG